MKLPLKITRHQESFSIRDVEETLICSLYFGVADEIQRRVAKRMTLEEAERVAKLIARSLTDAEKARTTPKDDAG